MTKLQPAVVVSANFKMNALKAISSIIFFIIIYLSLFILAIGLTLSCIYLAYILILAKLSFFTAMIAVGMVSLGFLILIFLIKFIFKEHIVDRSNLTEISAAEEPELFEFIHQIVNEVRTPFPKKIYLSAEVNASVFYDSSFLSMFLPIRKNLQIGLGLVNSVSIDEFKAILAHEFGHFSQRSMKIGSYVYNVNNIIYNLLYDNESYDRIIQKWSDVSSYFSFFAAIAIKIAKGIQFILQRVYKIVNITYLALSREMEFHADQVAAQVSGSQPLITSLLRLDLSISAYQTVIGFYNQRISQHQKTSNIYPNQQYVMSFIAREHGLKIENDLPQVDIHYLNKFNKSKLVIKNQWASHPNTEDRVRELKNINIVKENKNFQPASTLFKDLRVLQNSMTNYLFSGIQYTEEVQLLEDETFKKEFELVYRSNSFSPLFNNYYDSKNPRVFDVDHPDFEISSEEIDYKKLFSDEQVELVYQSHAMENDINVLFRLSNEEFDTKNFDYDGDKYYTDDCILLISRIKEELKRITEKIEENDNKIYSCFLGRADKINATTTFKSKYKSYCDFDIEFKIKYKLYQDLVNASAFIHQTTPFDTIEENLKLVYEMEIEFKKQINELLELPHFQSFITEEIRTNLKNYISNDIPYFYNPEYHMTALNLFFQALEHYEAILSQPYFNLKKDLLDYFEFLMNTKESEL